MLSTLPVPVGEDEVDEGELFVWSPDNAEWGEQVPRVWWTTEHRVFPPATISCLCPPRRSTRRPRRPLNRRRHRVHTSQRWPPSVRQDKGHRVL